MYVEARGYLDTINTMKPRTREIIVLGPTGNIQGSLFIFELNTGHVLKRRNVTVLPIPYRVIKKVDTWSRCAKNVTYTTDLKIPNITKDKYDWYNGGFDDTNEVVFLEGVPHPSIPADIPGVRLEVNIPVPVMVYVKETE